MPESSKLRVLRPISLSAFTAMVFLFHLLSSRSLLAYVYPDPACEQQCSDDFLFCVNNRCDPRASSCEFCQTDYDRCISVCPQVCAEPKNVRDYTITSYVNVQRTQATECVQGVSSATVDNKFYYKIRTDTYRETTHCDNTKTTQLLSSTLSGQLTCWGALNPLQYCQRRQIRNHLSVLDSGMRVPWITGFPKATPSSIVILGAISFDLDFRYTPKYRASGCWNTSAETLASGSIMSPSVRWTPISSGRRALKSSRWKARSGQAG